MKTFIYTGTLFLLAPMLISCGAEEQKLMDRPTISVNVKPIIAEDHSAFVRASGRIEAEKSANISTRMMGYVTDLHVKVGEPVSGGQLLISINNADLQAKKGQVEASIAQATAGYGNAKKDYDRFVTLFSQGSASQKELDDMTTRYEMAKASLEAAEHMKKEVQAQFSYSDIRAPFAGVVTNTFVKAGDMANPGMPLLGLESRASLQVAAMVSESDIDWITRGMEVTVFVKSLDQQVSGVVSQVSSSARNTGGQYLVKIDIKASNASVLSGMFVNVLFPVKKSDSIKSMVLVPERALIRQGQLTGIYTVGSENVAILRWLRIGKAFGDQVEILSGLSLDESYILSADSKLYNGAKVTF